MTLEERRLSMRVQVRERLGSTVDTRDRRDGFARRDEGGGFVEIGWCVAFVIMVFCVIVILLLSVYLDRGEGVSVRGSGAWSGIGGRWEG